MVQPVSVAVPRLVLNRPPPAAAELPLMVQSVSVIVPSLYRPPPYPAVEPPEMVRPLRVAVTPLSTWNTRNSPPPLTVTPAAGPMIVSVPLVLLSSSWPAVNVIVWAVAKTVGVEGDRLGPGQNIGQVDRPAQVELAGRAVGAVGGRVDHQRDGLGLEGADVHGAVDDAGVAALVGGDTAGNERRCYPRRWLGCPGSKAMSGSGRRSRPAAPAGGQAAGDGAGQVGADPAGAAVGLADQVVALGDEGSVRIGPAGGGRVPRHDGVADGQSPLPLDELYSATAAARLGGVAADGAVDQRRPWRRDRCRWTRCAAVAGGVAADGAVGQRGRAALLYRPPPLAAGGVAADGAVGQRGRAAVGVAQAAAVVAGGVAAEVQSVSVAVPSLRCRPPPMLSAELPLTVQLVSVVTLPRLFSRPPPDWPAELPLIVQSVSVAVPPSKLTVRRRCRQCGGPSCR